MLSLEQLAAFASHKSPQRDLVAVLLGLCTGSCLNTLALRTLREENPFWPPSHCPSCKRRLGILDLFPVLSYVVLKGKCRHCSYRIPWYFWFVEIFTAAAFVVVIKAFDNNGWDQLGMLIFTSILITVCVTDFKEKIIPHEVTYPAILLGLLYTGTVSEITNRWGDIPPLWTALAGVGVSYILFDFLAFYGLKIYLSSHNPDGSLKKKKGGRADQEEDEDEDESESEAEKKQDREEKEKEAAPNAEPAPLADAALDDEEIDPQIDTAFDIAPAKPEDEELEVMGGGDAVMAALIAAWLNLDKLCIALLTGFLIGAVMGGCYLTYDLIQAKNIRKAVVPAALGAALVSAVVLGFLTLIAKLSPSSAPGLPVWIVAALISIFGGAMLGVIQAGKEHARPFPFGPALAVGAFIAMFWNRLGNF